jgi:(p)ppGpp synthase/HD superfamily hydrolase
MITCWKDIYAQCQTIMSNSLDLIYSDTSEIITSLNEKLGNLQNEKEEEIASFSLKYISLPQNTKKLLETQDEEKLSLLSEVLSKCALIRRNSVIKELSSLRAFEDNVD